MKCGLGISMNNVIANIGVLTIDRMLLAFYLFILMIFLAGKYQQEVYGYYQYALALGFIISLFLQFADEKIIKNLMNSGDTASIMVATFYLKLLLSIIVIAGYCMFTFVYELVPEVKACLFYFVCANIVLNLSYAIYVYFDFLSISTNRVKATALGNTIAFLLQLYFLYKGLSIEFIALAVLIGAMSTSFTLFLLLLATPLQFKPHVNWKLINRIFKTSIPFTLAAAAHMIYMRTDLIMVEYYMDYQDVAMYSVAMQLTALATVISYPLQVSFFPRLLKLRSKSKDLYLKEYAKLTNLFTLIGVVVGIVGIILIGPFINIFLNESYYPITNFFIIQLASAVLIYNSVLRSSHITFIEQGHILLSAQVFSLFTNILLNFLLIPILGLRGAAIATFVTVAISLLLSNYLFRDTKVLFWIQTKAFFEIINFRNFIRQITKDN